MCYNVENIPRDRKGVPDPEQEEPANAGYYYICADVHAAESMITGKVTKNDSVYQSKVTNRTDCFCLVLTNEIRHAII